MLHKFTVAFVTLFIFWGCAKNEEPVVQEGWQILEDSWYSVTIDGVKSGWAHDTTEIDGATKNVKSSKTQNMTLSRGGIEISIVVTSVFLETDDGKPISVVSSQEAMGQVQETTWLFGSDSIEMTTSAGGTPIVKEVPLPLESWLTPNALRKMFKQKIKDGNPVFTFQTMSPELGPSLITVVMTKIGEETRDILGKETHVTIWESVNDKMPIGSTEVYTIDGSNVGTSIAAAFGAIVNTLMYKHDALSPLNEVPELMVSLFVEPNKKIDNSKKRLSLKIKSKDGSAVDLPSAGYQTASRNDDGTAILIIDLHKPSAATEIELNDESYLADTAICDGSDEAVRVIAHDTISAMPKNSTKADQALALRATVYDYIDEKGMSTVFGSASQTARDKKGDCSEHAVLLCGLLRAAGIPSRGVMGMVYIPNYNSPNGVFGWHMWTQALIDGEWIDLDATLLEPFTVGHVATMTSSLSDEGMAEEMAGIMSTIGNLEVEVVEEDEQ